MNPGLIRKFADPVAGWVVIADPDFGDGVAGDGAAHFTRLAPDQLRVVAANAAADVGGITVASGFGGPDAHHVRGSGARPVDHKEILAIDGVRAVTELALM